MKIYRECTEKMYYFLTIDTTLPASYLRFRKILFHSYKNDSNDQLKIIDNKIEANQAQYDLDKLAAIIYAKPSSKLAKYEYLTGEDLRYKAGVVEQAKFDYSPLSNIFNKGLNKDDQKEGLFEKC